MAAVKMMNLFDAGITRIKLKKSYLFDCRIRRIPLNCVEPLHQKSVTDP